MKALTTSLGAALLAAALAATPAEAHDGKDHKAPGVTMPAPATAPAEAMGAPAGDAAAREAKARAYFTDLPLLDVDGNELRFFSDVLKGKTVLIYLFYTGCGDACPLINAKLADLQDQLGDRVGKDIVFISLTVDPENDTPAVMKEYARKFEAGPGWYFLTGSKENVQTIVSKLGNTSTEPADHTAALFLGNVEQARWRKLPAVLPLEQIGEVLKMLAEGKRA